MEITEELLKKYAQGNCTREEIQAVEVWLIDGSNEADFQYQEEFSLAKPRIWTRLSFDFPKKDTQTIPIYKKISRYAAVALLGMGVISASYFLTIENAHTEVAFTSFGLDSEVQKSAEKVKFYLKPSSSVHGWINRFSAQGNLNFNGTFRLINQADGSLEIAFAAGNKEITKPRKINIKSNQMYYIGELKQANQPDQILVLSQFQLDNIPPRIKIMAFKDYSI